MEDLRIKKIERIKKISVTVNGIKTTAYQGESLLAVLVASGFRSIKHSPVINEPRGALCGMGVCFECTATVDGESNVRTCMVYAEEGMEIEIEE